MKYHLPSKDIFPKLDSNDVDFIATYGDKMIYAGNWNSGRCTLLQAYANENNCVLDVRSPNGSWIFDIAPEAEVRT